MASEALNILCKWRVLLTGWQLGTRAKGDAEADAVRDHREATLLLRAEVTTLVELLIRKGVFTLDEFQQQLDIEAGLQSQAYERAFPGVHAGMDGLHIDMAKAAPWLQRFRP